MNFSSFADLETPVYEEPRFPVEAPDGRKDLSEHERQSWFVAYMRRTQPHIEVHANMNHGRRSQTRAKREGMKAGVFDVTVAWDYRLTPGAPVSVAWVEFKGYETASKRPGKLQPSQIDWGNAMLDKGFAVACFFSAKSCIEWLRKIGCPLRGTA